MMSRIQYIDLFSGCGGISLGLYNAGLQGLFAIEKHSDAFLTLEHNLISRKHFAWPKWLLKKNWDINEILTSKSEALGKLKGKVDLVVGGPPCQGFSVAGRRIASDERNNLILSYLSFVETIRPRIIVFENVRGFTQRFPKWENNQDETYARIVLRKLIDLGYSDAQGEMFKFIEYGIPQKRERFIVIATLENISNDILSVIINNRAKFLLNKGLQAKNGSQTALSDLEYRHGVKACPDSNGFMSGIIHEEFNDYQKYFRLDNKETYIPDSHRYVNHTPEVKGLFESLLKNAPRNKTINGNDKKIYGIRKRSLTVLHADEPAPTITTIPDDCIHYSEPRILSVRECARLQTFPDWFEFKGPYTTGGKQRVKQTPRYTQVGNAVPPLFAEQLGIAIKKVLLKNKE